MDSKIIVNSILLIFYFIDLHAVDEWWIAKYEPHIWYNISCMVLIH